MERRNSRKEKYDSGFFINYFTISTCELFVRVQLVIVKSRTYRLRSLLLDVGLNIIRFSCWTAYQLAANLPFTYLYTYSMEQSPS